MFLRDKHTSLLLRRVRAKKSSIDIDISLSVYSTLGRLFALPTNNRLGSKGLLGTSTLAYWEHLSSIVIDISLMLCFTLGVGSLPYPKT
jgi:hypothetical protein